MTRIRIGFLVAGLSVGFWAASFGVGSSAPASKVTPFIQWAVQDDFVSSDPHDPLVVKDKVVVGTDRGELRAYRCKDGKSVWTYSDGERIYYRPCSDGERVYFTSINGMTAVLVADGTKAWSISLPCSEGPVIVLGKPGIVCVGGHDGILYAVEAKTGKQVWTSDFITDAPNFPGARAGLENTSARPTDLASDGETLFLSVFNQCRLVAVNATTGKRLWSYQANGRVFGAAVATDKHIFLGSQDNAFCCLDKKTGNQVWKHETQGRVESGGAVDKEFVYFASCDGSVHCLGQSDGKQRWRFKTDRRDGRSSAIYSVPLLGGAQIFFAAGEGQVYAVDKITGELEWKIRPSEGSELFCTLATDGARYIVVTRARDKEEGGPSLVAIGLK